MIAKLTIEGYEFDLLNFDYSITREGNLFGLFGGILNLILEAQENDDFLHYTMSGKPNEPTKFFNGKIEYQKYSGDESVQCLDFWDGFSCGLEVTSDIYSSYPMILKLNISAATVRYYNKAVFQKSWYQTPITPPPSKVYEREEEKKEEINPTPPILIFHIRSFISVATIGDGVGGKHHGDNRGASLCVDNNTTYRGYAKFTYNTKNRKTVINFAEAGETKADLFFGMYSAQGKAKVKYNKNQYRHGNKEVIDLMYSTANPVMPQFVTPFVDANNRFVIDYNKNNNTVNIAFTAKADGFPSMESFVEDCSGNKLFLGVSKEINSPMEELFGGADTLRYTGNIAIVLNENGTFKNVNLQGKTYNIDEYNKIIEYSF